LARCRRINLVELEAVIMLEVAHPRRDQKRPDEALVVAWCDGPPWAYQRTLDQAEALLRELG
jgi:hypothetical protein